MSNPNDNIVKKIARGFVYALVIVAVIVTLPRWLEAQQESVRNSAEANSNQYRAVMEHRHSQSPAIKKAANDAMSDNLLTYGEYRVIEDLVEREYINQVKEVNRIIIQTETEFTGT